jgi:hypothetical protein
MLISEAISKKLSEAANAGFSPNECLEYAGIPAYFLVEVGKNDAHNPNFPIEYWEPVDAFTTLDEAQQCAKKEKFITRIKELT